MNITYINASIFLPFVKRKVLLFLCVYVWDFFLGKNVGKLALMLLGI